MKQSRGKRSVGAKPSSGTGTNGQTEGREIKPSIKMPKRNGREMHGFERGIIHSLVEEIVRERIPWYGRKGVPPCVLKRFNLSAIADGSGVQTVLVWAWNRGVRDPREVIDGLTNQVRRSISNVEKSLQEARRL